MNRYRRYIPIAAAILVLFGFNLDRIGIDLEALSLGESSSQQNLSADHKNLNRNDAALSYPKSKQWSSTTPEINLWHVFDGEINRKNNPTGYHSRPGGIDAANARLVSIKDKPNQAGVYTAEIEIRDGDRWKPKFSSFFPDSLSQQEVIKAILHAYSKSSKQQQWEGPSGLGFTIQGYTTNRGGINTAFPLYRRDQ